MGYRALLAFAVISVASAASAQDGGELEAIAETMEQARPAPSEPLAEVPDPGTGAGAQAAETWSAPKEDKWQLKCSDFRKREAAQNVFLKDPVRFAHLDSDSDGLACESLERREAGAECPKGLTEETWETCGMGVAPRIPRRY